MRLSVISFILFMLMTCQLALSGAPAAGIYRIVPKDCGSVVGVLPAYSPFNGFPTIGLVPPVVGNLDQEFSVTKHSGEFYKIFSQSNPTKVLTATVPGLNYPICLHLPYDDSYAVEQWKFVPAGSGYYFIESRYYVGSVFESAYDAVHGQTYVYQNPKTGKDNQLFRLEKVGCVPYSNSKRKDITRATALGAEGTASVALDSVAAAAEVADPTKQ